MSAHTSLFSGTWVEGSRIDFQFYKDNDIYSREGVGIAFNPTRFKEKKTNRAVSPLSRQRSVSETVAVNSLSLLCTRARTRRCCLHNSSLHAGDGQQSWGIPLQLGGVNLERLTAALQTSPALAGTKSGGSSLNTELQRMKTELG